MKEKYIPSSEELKKAEEMMPEKDRKSIEKFSSSIDNLLAIVRHWVKINTFSTYENDKGEYIVDINEGELKFSLPFNLKDVISELEKSEK